MAGVLTAGLTRLSGLRRGTCRLVRKTACAWRCRNRIGESRACRLRWLAVLSRLLLLSEWLLAKLLLAELLLVLLLVRLTWLGHLTRLVNLSRYSTWTGLICEARFTALHWLTGLDLALLNYLTRLRHLALLIWLTVRWHAGIDDLGAVAE